MRPTPTPRAVYQHLSRAALEVVQGEAHAAGRSTVRYKGSLYKWLDSESAAIRVTQIAARVIHAYDDALPVAPLPEYDVHALRAGLRDHLDLRPASKASLAELRPTFPMTLADLFRGPRTNPAPLFPKDRYDRQGAYGSRIAQELGISDDRDLYRAYEAEAWRVSAPEGMPPIPRKGGRYSAAEAGMIKNWLNNVWAVTFAWRRLCEKASRRLIEGGADPSILGGDDKDDPVGAVLGPQTRMDATYYDRSAENTERKQYLDAEGFTPREFVARVYLWGEYIRPVLAAIEPLSDPELYRRSAGEPENADAVWATIAAASEGVGTGNLRTHWLRYIAKLNHERIMVGNREEKLTYLVEYGKMLPSAAIREARRQHAEYLLQRTAGEDTLHAERVQLARAFAPLTAQGKAWGGPTMTRLLPAGFTIEPAESKPSYVMADRRSEVSIRTPSGRRISATGTDRAAAWEKLRVDLGKLA